MNCSSMFKKRYLGSGKDPTLAVFDYPLLGQRQSEPSNIGFFGTVTWYKWTNQIAQLRQVYNIIQILDGGESTIQFTGRRKAIMDEAKPSPLSLFFVP